MTRAAMESTGVYGKPVYNILGNACELILVNARHIKQVPGRKTDKADCAWIASLLRHGLPEAGFVPPGEIRQLRDLCRMRTTLLRECVQVGNLLRKVLEGANIKLDSVASDALGKSGRAIIQALIEGERYPSALASLALGRLKSRQEPPRAALEGRMTAHHRFLLRELMEQLEYLESKVTRLEREIEPHMPPFEWAAAQLVTMPGVDRVAACALIAGIGVDMTRFASARHLVSWAGLCPGNHESADKRRDGKSHRGNRWIKGLMTVIAWAAARTKGTYASSFYRRLTVRRGARRALVALANAHPQTMWVQLTRRVEYRDLGADCFDRIRKHDATRALVRRLEKLGYKATREPAA